MRALRLLFLLLPLGANAQIWFSQDTTFAENPFYYRYSAGENVFTKSIISVTESDDNGAYVNKYLIVNPFFDLKLAKGNNQNYVKNGRGILLEGMHGNFKFFSALQEVQEDAYAYQRLLADSAIALRGHNRYKRTAEGDFDYADFMGGVEFLGDNVSYSIGWHPVRVGSGIRPVFISNQNTGFFNYQGRYFSNNKKFRFQQGSGIILGNERLAKDSQTRSETGIERYRFSWANASMEFVDGLLLNLYLDTYAPMFDAERKAIQSSALDYIPLSIFFGKTNGFRRYGGELSYSINSLKFYGGLLVNDMTFGGVQYFKTFNSNFKLHAEAQVNIYQNSTANTIEIFGNSLSSPYEQLNQEALSYIYLSFKNFRINASANYFNSEISNGLNYNLAFGYCLHKPSELILKVFIEERRFPQPESYVGIGLGNFLGINKNTY